MEVISIFVSVLALFISALTAWYTLLRKGNIKITQPTMVAFLHDPSKHISPKVYFRTLLYSTAARGQVVENMYIRLARGETVQTFNIWAYASEEKPMSRGSGLYVGAEGITLNHHFMPPQDAEYTFGAGDYAIEVYVIVVGNRKPRLLSTVKLSLNQEEAFKLKDVRAGVFFDWGPDSRKYHSYIDVRQPE